MKYEATSLELLIYFNHRPGHIFLQLHPAS